MVSVTVSKYHPILIFLEIANVFQRFRRYNKKKHIDKQFYTNNVGQNT